MATTRYDVLGIGNAIVDVIARADDDFLVRQNMRKGAMQLIDEARAEAIYDAMGPAVEISGGSAAHTTVGGASLRAGSGERRVGEEGRSRGAPVSLKKKKSILDLSVALRLCGTGTVGAKDQRSRRVPPYSSFARTERGVVSVICDVLVTEILSTSMLES